MEASVSPAFTLWITVFVGTFALPDCFALSCFGAGEVFCGSFLAADVSFSGSVISGISFTGSPGCTGTKARSPGSAVSRRA